MYIVVIGGGNVGTQLAKKLVARGHEVVLMEKNSGQASRLASILGDEHVMHGDGCEINTQRKAGFNRADVIVAVTGEDEDNLVACQLSKMMWKVKRVVARVNDPNHEEVFRRIGIDDTVSATGIIFSLIDEQISSDEIIPIGAMHRGHLEVVENIISARSPLAHRKVRDLALPPSSFLVYVQRAGSGFRVDADTELLPDDTVIAIVPTNRAEALREALGGRV